MNVSKHSLSSVGSAAKRKASVTATSLFMACALSSHSTACAGTTEGLRFLHQCHVRHVDTRLPYGRVASDPGLYGGRAVLVLGKIVGSCESAEHTDYIVESDDGAQMTLTAPTGQPLGASIGALALVPEGWQLTAHLDALSIVQRDDYDAAVEAIRPRLRSIPIEPGYRYRSRGRGNRHPFHPTTERWNNSRVASRAYYGGYSPVSRSYADVGLDRSTLRAYTEAVRYFNPRLSRTRAQAIASHVLTCSVVNGVDARLVMAVIAVESEFNTHSRSRKGAMGLAQLMPGTARDLGVNNAYDAEQNISGAVRLIRWHLLQNQGQEDPLGFALACYNAGENAVKRHHGVPPFRETQRYIARVKELYDLMRRNG